MPDVFTPAKRSEVMSRIRGRGNRDTELALARLFRKHHVKGWRRQFKLKIRDMRNSKHKATPQTQRNARTRSTETLSQFVVCPDFVFVRRRTAVFVDGCFWHGCPEHSKQPMNNKAFWAKKLAANKSRDRLVSRSLRKSGWRVVRLWEHDLVRRAGECIRRVRRTLKVNGVRRRPTTGSDLHNV
jgi:DNA mismatch endonuclease (patch repair protein)